ncbi:uncharacterized protein [Epargyreus clarus]|uniref:uncharacterized protein n=1 Tax=Epargyreus clarus TaxID=520877 RepID=UPI003C30409A
MSDPYKLDCGVRPGGLTSPRLFNLYVNQLIERLSGAGVGCSIDGLSINNISYADDMVLLSPSVSGLRRLLKICEEYAGVNGLSYNAKKSDILVFRRRNKESTFKPTFQLCGSPLKQVAEFRYLGHIVDECLGDDRDIERERRAMSVRGNMLARRFKRCSKQRTLRALRVQYNNVLRVVLGKPCFCSASAMFAEARIDDFYAIVRKRMASMMKRVMGTTNALLSTLWQSA